MFLVTYSWGLPQNGYFGYYSPDAEPFRTLGILVLIIAVLSIIHGFETSFFEIALGSLILVWMILVLGWFFPGTVGRGYYNFLQEVNVSFTYEQLISYASIGITLEIAMIAHGIYRGKKGKYVPQQSNKVS